MGEYLVKGTYYDEEVDKSIPTEEIVIADGFHIESGQVLVFTPLPKVLDRPVVRPALSFLECAYVALIERLSKVGHV